MKIGFEIKVGINQAKKLVESLINVYNEENEKTQKDVFLKFGNLLKNSEISFYIGKKEKSSR